MSKSKALQYSFYHFLQPQLCSLASACILSSVMPKRKHHLPQAKFVFAAPRTVATGSDRGKPHSRTTRSHAAYWGGPIRKIRKTDALAQVKDDQASGAVCNDTGTEASPGDFLSCSRGPIRLFPTSATCTLLSNETVKYAVGPTTDLPVASLFGRKFLDQISASYGRESPMLAKGYLLVTIAYSMAVTGKGDRTVFLCLKEQLLQCVLQDIQGRQGRASLQSMGVMLMLGSPIVCLLSRRLPGGLQVAEYLTASADSEQLCCADSAAIAEESLHEKEIHWRHLKEMIKGERRLRYERVGQLDWLKYLSRYLEMYESWLDASSIT